MIKLPVVAALCTVLSQAIHNPSVDAISPAEMHAYSSILYMLTTLAEKSRDAELKRARDLCMTLFSKIDSARRVREMQNMSSLEIRPFRMKEVIF